MEVDPAALTHFCGEGASVALQGHQLRLQPSDAGTARVETKLTVEANTRYRLSGRITSGAPLNPYNLSAHNLSLCSLCLP